MENLYLKKLLEGNISKEDIKKIILYDVKKDVMEKEICKKVFLSGKYNAKFLAYENELYYNENESSLKNMLKYTTINKYKYTFDCDTSLFARKIIEKIYGVTEYGTSGRHFLKNGAIFESDTMNSFSTIFMYYLRTVLAEENKDLFIEYTKKYNCSKSYFFRSLYILEEIDNIKENIKEKYEENGKENIHKKIFEQLEIFATLTHSIGNFAVVPFRFNCYRGKKYYDYWYKSYFDSIKNDNLVSQILQNIKIIKEEDIIYESIREYKKLDKEFDLPIEIDGKINFNTKIIGKCCMDTYTNILNILVYMNISILKRAVNICNRLTNKIDNEFNNEFNINKFEVENVENYIIKINNFVKK